jgi:hypothetical protein
MVMTPAPGNPLVRCGWCPGASLKVQRIARVPCAACRTRVLDYRAVCPECGGAVFIDPEAGCLFCADCEFTLARPAGAIG